MTNYTPLPDPPASRGANSKHSPSELSFPVTKVILGSCFGFFFLFFSLLKKDSEYFSAGFTSLPYPVLCLMILPTFIINKMIIEILYKTATKTILLRNQKICSVFLTLITLEEKCCAVSSYRHFIVLTEAKSLTHCLFLCLELQPGYFFILFPSSKG